MRYCTPLGKMHLYLFVHNVGSSVVERFAHFGAAFFEDSAHAL